MQQASGNQRAVAVVTAVAAALFLGHALFFWPTWVDDAYITFRHSRNLWHGDGLVFNPGQRVEGLTDLAWGVLLAPFSEHDPMFVAKVLGLLSSLGTVGLVGGWAHAEGLGPRGAAAALAPLVLAPWAPYWAVQGLETPVVMLLVTLAWTRYRREADGRSPWPLVALGAGAAPAFRPDSAVLALLLGAWYLLRPGRRLSRRVLTSAALVIALAAALLCTKIAWYGAILPLTWQAKRAPWPHLAGWHYLAALFQGPWPPFAIILGIATAFSLASLRKRDERALPGLVVLAWAAVAVVSNGDYFASWRLLVPALPAAGAALGLLAARGGFAWSAAVIALTVGTLPAIAAVEGLDRAEDFPRAHLRVQAKSDAPFSPFRVSDPVVTLAESRAFPAAWVLVHTNPLETVSFNDIGLFAFVNDNPVVDPHGLTDPFMARARSKVGDRASERELRLYLLDKVHFSLVDRGSMSWEWWQRTARHDGWKVVDGCDTMVVYANPSLDRDASGAYQHGLAERIERAVARAPGQLGLQVAIARELVATDADPSLVTTVLDRVRQRFPRFSEFALPEIRCAAGLDGCPPQRDLCGGVQPASRRP